MRKFYPLLTLFLIFFMTAQVIAQQTLTLNQSKIDQVLSESTNPAARTALKSGDYMVLSSYTSRGITYTNIQQLVDGIKVYNSIATIAEKNGEVVSVKGNFATPSKGTQFSGSVSMNPETAISKIASNYNLSAAPATSLIKQERMIKGMATQKTFSKGGIAAENIQTELNWVVSQNGKLKLAWLVSLYTTDQQNWYNTQIDVSSGEVLEEYNWVQHCSFETPCAEKHNTGTHHYTTNYNEQSEQRNLIPVGANYRVYDVPLESPNHGARTVVTDPWNRAGAGNNAVTLGWHEDGTTEYTNTRGNNVYAYEDQNATNTPSANSSPSSATFNFDYPIDLSQPNAAYENAAITNLFFWNNIVHDILYQYGFDEPSGNFQETNFGRGGAGGDSVNAEAQDGGGVNNANFSTPQDGGNGRMQMFLWSEVPGATTFTVNSPSGIAGNYDALESVFSTANKLSDLGPISGNLVISDDNATNPDGAGTFTDACQALVNGAAVNGNIAVIDRGDCAFTVKVANAEAAGAIAVLMVNNVAGSPIPMGGTDNTITIPAIMISQADGNTIKNAINNGTVNVTMSGEPSYQPDGDFDNGIVVHEYGHGVSTRLTGGPTTNCLGNDEQMGEGWSDYIGLMLTTDWATAVATDRRGIGTYSTGQPTDGPGIRTFPYSTDFGINSFTYQNINDSSPSTTNPGSPFSPHFHGSVWATMLWEMTWEIIGQTPVSTDMYAGNGGNNIALNLVMEGMKLQGCSPGFVDGRDGILAADELLYNGAYKCAIWAAFARRGLGASADQEDNDNVYDGVEAFDIPGGVVVEKIADKDFARESEEITYTVEVKSNCVALTNVTVEDVLPTGLTYVPGSGGSFDGSKVSFGPFSMATAATNTFTYKATVDYGTYQDPTFLLDDDVEGITTFTVSRGVPAGGGQAAVNWATSTAQAVSGTTSWFALNHTAESDLYLTSASYDLSTIMSPTLSFMHFYNTEDTWDGGVVELSIDGGTNWIDLGADMIENGYNSTINVNPASAISGRDAFTGNSGGFLQTTILLSDYASETNAQFRFRMASDANTVEEGWYIDDIQLASNSVVINTAEGFINGTSAGTSSASTEVGCGAPLTIPTVAGTYTATKACTDDTDWTHYIDDRGNADPSDDLLLLSVNKNSQNIGDIGDGTFEVTVTLEPGYNTGAGIDLSAADYVSELGFTDWYVMNRWWDVVPNADGAGGNISGNVGVRFYLDATDLSDLSGSVGSTVDLADLSMYKVNAPIPSPNLAVHQNLSAGTDFFQLAPGTASLTEWEQPDDAQLRVASDITITEQLVNSFSGGGGGSFSGSVTLPVELTSFEGENNGCDVSVTWTTASEVDCSTFELQRSVDGVMFETIATLNCAGSATSNASYALTDEGLESGSYMYRLQQFDNDGSFEFSKTIEVRVNCISATDFRIYPNPSRGFITLDRPAEMSEVSRISIYSPEGKLVKVFLPTDGPALSITMDIELLATGNYFVRTSFKDGSVITRLITVTE